MKIKELQKIMKRKKVDACLLLNTSLNKLDPNINYFTGLTLEYACLMIYLHTSKLIVPKLDEEKAGEKSFIKDVETIESRNFTELLGALKLKNKKIGINQNYLSLKEFKELKKLKNKFVDISEDLENLRTVKTNREIKIIKKSCSIADAILNDCFRNFHKFKTEDDIFNFLNIETLKHNCKVSFKPIVASGKNASIPHHEPEGRLMSGFCIIDFGVKYRGYCSDITRTVFIGKPTEKERELYNLILRTQEDAIKKLKINRKCSLIDKHTRRNFGEYAKMFIHSLGHGIGVEIHEKPILSLKSKDVLKKNMIFTIEPGIYKKGKFGIRIEDDILMQEKPEVLTKSSKELRCFKP